MSTKNEMEAFKVLMAYRDALAAGESGDEAANQFENVIMNVEDYTRQSELQQIFATLNFASIDNAVKDFGKVAKQFAELKDAFEISKKLAEGGKDNLFFPSVAAELATVSATVTALKEASDNLDVSGLTEAFDAGDAETLVKEAQTIIDEAKKLKEKLTEVKSQMP